jgi:hypothetical protein
MSLRGNRQDGPAHRDTKVKMCNINYCACLTSASGFREDAKARIFLEVKYPVTAEVVMTCITRWRRQNT